MHLNAEIFCFVLDQADGVLSSGAWCAQRSGIKEEAAGRGTAAELCTTQVPERAQTSPCPSMQ
jgi:hypothetical protein